MKKYLPIYIACLVAGFFNPWFIIPACLVWATLTLEKHKELDDKEIQQIKERILKLERFKG